MSTAEHSLRYIERESLLHRIYPLAKLAWVFVVAIGLFFYHSPISGAVMLLVVVATAMIAGKIPLRTILESSKLIFGLGIILMIFHFFADPGEPVFRVGFLTATDNGLRQGPIFFFRLSVVVLASFVLIWTTDSRDLMVSFAKAGMPYRYAFAVFLALRFLPLIQREVDAVQSAHAIRGRAARSGIVHRIRLWQRYMFTVLVNGLRKAEATAAALDCRAFGSYPDRTYVKDITFHPADLALVAIFFALTTGLVLMERL
ncbi:MAG TPA: energy-coupling factor transporter transmembrane component T [Anaerolineaceae bacterium]|nr:energy-coupling factor transporter transmembrane component T [Anaerolineaceae bacterium]